MLIHAAIHRRRDQERTTQRERREGEHVLSEARDELRDGLGGAGRDEAKIGTLTEGDVGDVAGFAVSRIPHIGMDGLAGDRAKAERRHESSRGIAEDDRHARATLSQLASEVNGFIGGDAAGYAEEQMLASEDGWVAHGCAPVH